MLLMALSASAQRRRLDCPSLAFKYRQFLVKALRLPRKLLMARGLLGFSMAKILIIEDDVHVRAAIQHCLTRAGHTVSPAADGKEGMSTLRGSAMDLVVTDLFMPEQDGLETIAALRKQHPKLPVIAISGGSLVSATMLSVARELGAQEVLQKPFGTDGLLAAVEKVLGNN